MSSLLIPTLWTWKNDWMHSWERDHRRQSLQNRLHWWCQSRLDCHPMEMLPTILCYHHQKYLSTSHHGPPIMKVNWENKIIVLEILNNSSNFRLQIFFVDVDSKWGPVREASVEIFVIRVASCPVNTTIRVQWGDQMNFTLVQQLCYLFIKLILFTQSSEMKFFNTSFLGR